MPLRLQHPACPPPARQEQKARIVGFIFESEDRARYAAAGAGDLFRPKRLPAAILLQVEGFADSPMRDEAIHFVTTEDEQRFIDDEMDDLLHRGDTHAATSRLRERDRRARGLLCLEPCKVQIRRRTSAFHAVTRTGLCLARGA